MDISTPLSEGLRFPAEWHPHKATWLSWPHNTDTWHSGILQKMYEPYSYFVKYLSQGEQVNIHVNNLAMEKLARKCLNEVGADLTKISFHHHPTNDAWIRDHGPAFVIDDQTKAIVDWEYNAWGGKYPPYEDDNRIPAAIAKISDLRCFKPGIILEGGSLDFNGAGTVMTTTSCLLNPNRNPQLNQSEIENYLRQYYGVHDIWWLGDGIIGDDTDGHIDDITRFIAPTTIVTVTEQNSADANHEPLAANLDKLRTFRFANGERPNIVELPMPKPVVFEGERLPASYANFYIANEQVIVPTYRDPKHDPLALEILQSLFADRKVIGIDATDIIVGLGSFHCLSQQEPAIS